MKKIILRVSRKKRSKFLKNQENLTTKFLKNNIKQYNTAVIFLKLKEIKYKPTEKVLSTQEYSYCHSQESLTNQDSANFSCKGINNTPTTFNYRRCPKIQT